MNTETLSGEKLNAVLNKWADEAHSTATSKGFWNIEKSVDNQKTLLMLVVSELCEGLEQHRKQKPKIADLKAFHDYMGGVNATEKDSEAFVKLYKAQFEVYVKDTIEDELADVVIRLLDFARGYSIAIDIERFNASPGLMQEKTFAGMLWQVSAMVHQFYFAMNKVADEVFLQERVVNTAILNVMHIAHKMNMELQMHIELKMQYNAYREQLNGKKY